VFFLFLNFVFLFFDFFRWNFFNCRVFWSENALSRVVSEWLSEVVNNNLKMLVT